MLKGMIQVPHCKILSTNSLVHLCLFIFSYLQCDNKVLAIWQNDDMILIFSILINSDINSDVYFDNSAFRKSLLIMVKAIRPVYTKYSSHSLFQTMHCGNVLSNRWSITTQYIIMHCALRKTGEQKKKTESCQNILFQQCYVEVCVDGGLARS